MTDEQLLQTASAARPTIDAWASYIAASSAAGAPWDLATNDQIAKAETSGRSAYECFRWLGAYTSNDIIPKGWWSYLRSSAGKYCDGFKHSVRDGAFDRDAELVLRVMTDKIREDDDQFVPGKSHNALD